MFFTSLLLLGNTHLEPEGEDVEHAPVLDQNKEMVGKEIKLNRVDEINPDEGYDGWREEMEELNDTDTVTADTTTLDPSPALLLNETDLPYRAVEGFEINSDDNEKKGK